MEHLSYLSNTLAAFEGSDCQTFVDVHSLFVVYIFILLWYSTGCSWFLDATLLAISRWRRFWELATREWERRKVVILKWFCYDVYLVVLCLISHSYGFLRFWIMKDSGIPNLFSPLLGGRIESGLSQGIFFILCICVSLY